MMTPLSPEEKTVWYLLLLPQTTGPEIDERLRPLLDGERDFDKLKSAVPADIEYNYPDANLKDLLERNPFLGGPYVDTPHRILERALTLGGGILGLHFIR